MKHALLLVALLASHSVQGQDAPDFTITDIDGQSHNLYAALDAGNTVVLKFFTNWCPICNNTAEDVEALWQGYQAAGDDVLIWALDRDANETNAHANTYRDNNGLTFPVIGEANSVAQLYGVLYQPEYYIVCPDRSFIQKVSYTEVDAPVQACLAQTTSVAEVRDGSLVRVQGNALVWQDATAGSGVVSISDLSGRAVLGGTMGSGTVFPLDGLNNGIYIYHVMAADGRSYQGKLRVGE